jgi:hypothetical protein
VDKAFPCQSRETDARTHLAEKYPKYLASLPFPKELADLRMGA